MTIKRTINGEDVDIELTFAELIEAGRENDIDNYSSDVLSKLEEMAESGEIPLTTEQLESIPEDVLKEFALDAAHHVDHDIGKNDSYFEAFWCTVEYVLTDRIEWDKELPKLLAAAKKAEG